jgi:hypothetical protein
MPNTWSSMVREERTGSGRDEQQKAGSWSDMLKPPEPDKLPFMQGLKAAWSEGAEKKGRLGGFSIPFLSSFRDFEEAYGLWDAARAIQAGTASQEQHDLVAELLQSPEKGGFGYLVGRILMDLPGFMGEFLVSGGILAGGKKAMGIGVREALENAVEHGAKDVLKKKAKQSLIKRLGKEVVETPIQLAIMEAMVGGHGRVGASTYQRAVPWESASITEDHYGQMKVTFDGTVETFLKALPRGTADMLIELFSERAGAYMLPGVNAAQYKVLERMVGKEVTGAQLSKALRSVARRAGWNGPINEWMEERLGGALRAATPGMEEFGDIEAIFPGLEQLAAEFVAFSLPTAGSIALGKVAGGAMASLEKGGEEAALRAKTPEFQEEPQEGEQPTLEESLAEVPARLEGIGEKAGEPVREAPEPTEGEAAEIAGTFRAHGVEPRYFETESGEPSAIPASYQGGVVLLDVNAKPGVLADEAWGVAVHETVHRVFQADPKLGRQLFRAMWQADPIGMREAILDYQTRAAEKGIEVGADLSLEEGLATYSQGLASYLQWAAKLGRSDAFSILLHDDRTKFKKVVDAIIRLLNTVPGINFSTTEVRRLKELSKELSEFAGEDIEATAEGLEAVELLRQAFAATAKGTSRKEAAAPVGEVAKEEVEAKKAPTKTPKQVKRAEKKGRTRARKAQAREELERTVQAGVPQAGDVVQVGERQGKVLDVTGPAAAERVKVAFEEGETGIFEAAEVETIAKREPETLTKRQRRARSAQAQEAEREGPQRFAISEGEKAAREKYGVVPYSEVSEGSYAAKWQPGGVRGGHPLSYAVLRKDGSGIARVWASRQYTKEGKRQRVSPKRLMVPVTESQAEALKARIQDEEQRRSWESSDPRQTYAISPGYYSQLRKKLAEMFRGKKVQVRNLVNLARNPAKFGVKEQEITHTGFLRWVETLDLGGTIPREALLTFFTERTETLRTNPHVFPGITLPPFPPRSGEVEIEETQIGKVTPLLVQEPRVDQPGHNLPVAAYSEHEEVTFNWDAESNYSPDEERIASEVSERMAGNYGDTPPMEEPVEEERELLRDWLTTIFLEKVEREHDPAQLHLFETPQDYFRRKKEEAHAAAEEIVDEWLPADSDGSSWYREGELDLLGPADINLPLTELVERAEDGDMWDLAEYADSGHSMSMYNEIEDEVETDARQMDRAYGGLWRASDNEDLGYEIQWMGGDETYVYSITSPDGDDLRDGQEIWDLDKVLEIVNEHAMNSGLLFTGHGGGETGELRVLANPDGMFDIVDEDGEVQQEMSTPGAAVEEAEGMVADEDSDYEFVTVQPEITVWIARENLRVTDEEAAKGGVEMPTAKWNVGGLLVRYWPVDNHWDVYDLPAVANDTAVSIPRGVTVEGLPETAPVGVLFESTQEDYAVQEAAKILQERGTLPPGAFPNYPTVAPGPKEGYFAKVLTVPRNIVPELGVSTHYPRVHNVFVHLHYSVRPTLDGRRVVFTEELQSDTHQQGRKVGYVQREFDTLKQAADHVHKARGGFFRAQMSWVQTGEDSYQLFEGSPETITAEEYLRLETVPARAYLPVSQMHAAAINVLWRGASYFKGPQLKPTHVSVVKDQLTGKWQIHLANNPARTASSLPQTTQVGAEIPVSPFSKTWPVIGMARLIHEAVHRGLDGIVMSAGYDQTARWGSLGFSYVRREDGSIELAGGGRDPRWEYNKPSREGVGAQLEDLELEIAGRLHGVDPPGHSDQRVVVLDNQLAVYEYLESVAKGGRSEDQNMKLAERIWQGSRELPYNPKAREEFEAWVKGNKEDPKHPTPFNFPEIGHQTARHHGMEGSYGTLPSAEHDWDQSHSGTFLQAMVTAYKEMAGVSRKEAEAALVRFPMDIANQAPSNDRWGIDLSELTKKTLKGKQTFALRKREVLLESFDMPEEGMWDAVRRRMQDRMLRLLRYQQRLVSWGGTINPDSDAYKAEERRYGRIDRRLRIHQRGEEDPILDMLEEAGISIPEIDLYLHARHAKERNQVIMDKYGEKQGWDHETKPGSAMKTSVAADIITRVEAGERGGTFMRVGQMVDRMNTRTRRRLRAEGLISKAQMAAWEDMYEHYVPLRHEEHGISPWTRTGTGQGLQVKGPEAKAAKGRKRQPDSALMFSFSQAHAGIIRGENNRIGAAFARLLRDNPKTLLWSEQRLEASTEVDPVTGGFKHALPKMMKPADDTFIYKENGQEVIIQLSDKLMARALKMHGMEGHGWMTAQAHKVTRALSMLATSLNPEFILSNFIRDIQTAGINLAGEQSGKLALDVIGDTPKAIRAVWRVLRMTSEQRENFTSRMVNPNPEDILVMRFIELEKHGGKTGYFTSPTVKEMVTRAERHAKRLTEGTSRKAFRSFFDLVQTANDAVENGVRLAAFHHARERGMSAKDAASLSKNLTVNFNRKGEISNSMNAWYMFYNASLQGATRMVQAMSHGHVQVMAGSIAVTAVGLDFVNTMLGGDDDDGEAFYDKIGDWEKARNLIIMLGPGSEGRYVKIPMPYGYNLFNAIGQNVGAMIRGAIETGRGKTLAEGASNIVGTTWEAFSPIGSEADALQLISPTITDPLVQQITNKTFYGAPIMPQQPAYGPPKPHSQLYFHKSVWKPAQKVTSALNEITGGDTVKPGWFDVSPESVEHWITFGTGGAGKFLGNSFNMLLSPWTGLPALRKTPVLRRIMGAPNEYAIVSRFYDNLEEVELAEDRVVALREDGRAKRADEVQRESAAWIRLGATAGSYRTKVRKLRKRARSQPAHRETLEKEIDKTMREFNRKVMVARRG